MKRVLLAMLGVWMAASLFAATAQEEAAVPVLFQASQTAEVLVRGKVIGTTPCAYFFSPKSRHTITFRADDYQPITFTLDVSDGRAQRIMKTLVAETCTLTVTSSPTGASVRFDDVAKGTTPLTLTRLKAGPHTLQFSMEDYDDVTREIVLGDGVTETINVELPRTPSTLTVTAEPKNATLTVDDEVVANGQTLTLGEGTYRIVAEAVDYVSETREVTLKPGDRKQVRFELQALPGAFEVITEPAEVTVWDNNRRLGATEPSKPGAFRSKPLKITLPRGEHALTFKADGYATVTKTITVESQETATLMLRMTFQPDYELSLTNGQKVQGVLRKTNADNSVRLELKPGMFRTYKPSEIRSQRFLKIAE